MKTFPRPSGAVALPIVARMFQGARLFLVRYSRHDGALCDWSADQSKAHVFGTTSSALGAAAFCALFWRADCGVIDGDGNVLQPAEAREFSAEPTGRAKRTEFTALPVERSIGCEQHAGFNDGCAACYALHAARSVA